MRISDDDWEHLLAAAKTQGSDRGSVIKELVAWYLRRPGGTLPKRPEASAWQQPRPVSGEEKNA